MKPPCLTIKHIYTELVEVHEWLFGEVTVKCLLSKRGGFIPIGIGTGNDH